MKNRIFSLPKEIKQLLEARDAVRDHYNRMLKRRGSEAELKFTFDGKLVGDIGEALAAQYFGIVLEGKNKEGIDGKIGKKTVQIKTTGTGRGPVFRNTKIKAKHLLFFDLNYESRKATLIYNGPLRIAIKPLGNFDGQKSLTRKQIEEADKKVSKNQRL